MINFISYVLPQKFNSPYWIWGMVICIVSSTIGYAFIHVFAKLATSEEQTAEAIFGAAFLTLVIIIQMEWCTSPAVLFLK